MTLAVRWLVALACGALLLENSGVSAEAYDVGRPNPDGCNNPWDPTPLMNCQGFWEVCVLKLKHEGLPGQCMYMCFTTEPVAKACYKGQKCIGLGSRGAFQTSGRKFRDKTRDHWLVSPYRDPKKYDFIWRKRYDTSKHTDPIGYCTSDGDERLKDRTPKKQCSKEEDCNFRALTCVIRKWKDTGGAKKGRCVTKCISDEYCQGIQRKSFCDRRLGSPKGWPPHFMGFCRKDSSENRKDNPPSKLVRKTHLFRYRSIERVHELHYDKKYKGHWGPTTKNDGR